MVEFTKDGKPFYRDAQGNILLVHSSDQPQVEID